MTGIDKTFSQLAESALSSILQVGTMSQRIDVVFDVYREISIMNTERANRGADMGIQFRNIAPGHSIQQWRKLLCSSSNKASLIKFLVNTWKQPLQREKLQEKVLYVTCEQECFKTSKDKWEDIVDLKSSQEEADTRILLHALRAGKSGYKEVVLKIQMS